MPSPASSVMPQSSSSVAPNFSSTSAAVAAGKVCPPQVSRSRLDRSYFSMAGSASMYMKPVGTASSMVARYRSTERSMSSDTNRSSRTSVEP